MIVKCVYSKVVDLPSSLSSSMKKIPKDFSYGDPQYGEIYKVYAINFQYETSFYCIQIDGITYPEWVPSQLFEVVDSSLSRYWVYQPTFNSEAELSNIISFESWVMNPYFYGELLEGYETNINVFNKYKKAIDEE